MKSTVAMLLTFLTVAGAAQAMIVLTGTGIALIVVNAMNTTSLLCLGLGLALLAYAGTERA